MVEVEIHLTLCNSKKFDPKKFNRKKHEAPVQIVHMTIRADVGFSQKIFGNVHYGKENDYRWKL